MEGSGERPTRAVRPIAWLVMGCFAAFFFGLIGVWSSGTVREASGNHLLELARIVVGLSLAVMSASIVWSRRVGWPDRLAEWLIKHSEEVDALPQDKLIFYVVLASALGLFAELMMIRVHACFFQMFAHFKNVSLLSCFLGLGIGYAQSRKTPVLMPLFVPLLAVQVFFLYLLRLGGMNMFLLNPAAEHSTIGLHAAESLSDQLMSMGFLTLVFVFNALCFIPLGQIASRLMQRMPELKAYGWNLLGSLLGIGVFTLLSLVWAPPAVWFFFVVAGTFFFLRSLGSLVAASASTLVVAVAMAFAPTPFSVDIYSPYQIITISTDYQKYVLNANNSFFQTIQDLRPESIQKDNNLAPIADYYAVPYLFKPNPPDVLIVGSGSGNDVASSIRHNAARVDAVEIDPAILYIGKHLHPERPYDDPYVNIINTDARHWIRFTDKKYDLIIYGLLDSQGSLGHTGSFRMDSYVWTVDAFREARAHLKPGGLIVATVCAFPVLGSKIFHMFKEAFDGHEPRAYHTQYDEGFCFVIGENIPEPAQKPPFEEMTAQYSTSTAPVDLATDDWPFLFMWSRSYPFGYMLVIAALLCLSSVITRRLIPASSTRFSLPCFFLGAGFMLVETKGITELALAYGSTWMVTSVVIAAILLLGFLANSLILRFGAPRPLVSYGLVIVSLLVGWCCSGTYSAGGSALSEQSSMTLVLTLPLFFSGFAFSAELKKNGSIASALYSNLLGAMVGGFLEYNSMYFGFRSLYLFAIAMYAGAFLATSRAQRSVGADQSPQSVADDAAEPKATGQKIVPSEEPIT